MITTPAKGTVVEIYGQGFAPNSPFDFYTRVLGIWVEILGSMSRPPGLRGATGACGSLPQRQSSVMAPSGLRQRRTRPRSTYSMSLALPVQGVAR
jgi:hypothetical protein